MKGYNVRVDFALITNFFSSLPADWIVFGCLIVFFTFDALRAGPSRAMALAIALPLALFIADGVKEATFIGSLSDTSTAVVGGTFAVITVALSLAMYRIVDTYSESAGPVRSPLAAIGAAVICAVVFTQLPADFLPWEPSSSFALVFGEAYRLYWFVGSYFLLAASRA